MSRIFWDTNLFIYLVEDSGVRARRVRGLLDQMIERRDELCTSAITLGEVLIKPLSLKRNDLVDRYQRLLNSPGVVLIDFDRECARLYATIRMDKVIRPPDAVQLACAARGAAQLFITNDERLSRARVPGIDFVVSLDRAP